MTTIYSITGETLYQSDKPTLKEAVEAAVAKGVSLKLAKLADADLKGVSLPGADMRCADLSRTNLRGAELSGADLSRADMRYTNLAFAVLTGAYLSYSNFYCSNLLYTTVTDVELASVQVNFAIFSPSTLKGATFNSHTVVSAATFGPIGSRIDNLLAVQTVDSLYFQTGCFTGTKEELLAAVESTHPDSQHGRDYRLAVDFLEAYLKDRNED